MNHEVFKEFPILETERLILRDIRLADVDSIFAIYSDPKVAEFDVFQPMTSIERAERLLLNYRRQFEEHDQIRWALTLKESNRLIGTCGIGDFVEESNRCEIGYDLLQEYWNCGYMTEAIRAVVAYGFEEMGLNRIEAFVSPGNDASIRVLKKANFVEEGIVRERDFFKGHYHDGIIFAIIRRDYEALLK